MRALVASEPLTGPLTEYGSNPRKPDEKTERQPMNE